MADALAERAHGNDRTRFGGRFLDHVRRVAACLHEDPDAYAVVAALLHDTVEKGTLDWADLRAAGADERLIRVVDALTERHGEPAHSYFGRVVEDPLALRIKRVDISDKLNVGTDDGLTADEVDHLHRRARQRLELLERLAADRRR